MAINKVILLGNVGNAPKMYTFDDGRKAAQISLATSTPEYTKKDGTKVNGVTEWHNVVLYTPLAEIVEKYVHKGDKLYIEGRNHYREYEANGVKQYFTEVIANSLELLTPKPKQPSPEPFAAAAPQQQPAQTTQVQQVAQPTQAVQGNSDDLPF